MASTAVDVVQLDWATTLNNRISLMKKASLEGDMSVCAALQVQNSFNKIDWTATALKKAEALGPGARDNVEQTVGEMKKAVETEVKNTNDDAQGIKSDLEEHAKSSGGKDPDAWRKRFNKSIDDQEEKSRAAWERLRDYGLKKLEQLPPDTRDHVVDVWTVAMGALTTFITQISDWLKKALGELVEWVIKAWEKIKEFAVAVKDWFVNAWHSVQDAFRDFFPAMEDEEEDFTKVDRLPNVEAITSKLKDTNLDRVNLVRKGTSWVLEIPV